MYQMSTNLVQFELSRLYWLDNTERIISDMSISNLYGRWSCLGPFTFFHLSLSLNFFLSQINIPVSDPQYGYTEIRVIFVPSSFRSLFDTCTQQFHFADCVL